MGRRLSLRIDGPSVEYGRTISQKVAVGIPVAGPPTWPLVIGLVSMRSPKGWSLSLAGKPDRPLPIPEARNQLVREMLKLPDCGWLLQLDRDAVIHPDTLIRLMSWDVPIVGPLIFGRYPPVMPIAFGESRPDLGADSYSVEIDEIRDWIGTHEEMWVCEPMVLEPRPADALAERALLGTHCLLVRRDVFEAVEPPWFQRISEPGRQSTGCDRYFGLKARAAGFPSYMDRSVVASHMYGERPLGALDFLAWDAITDWSNRKWVIGGKDHG